MSGRSALVLSGLRTAARPGTGQWLPLAAQAPDLIVVGHHILELAQHDRSHEARQGIVQSVPVDLERSAFATLTLIENNLIFVTSKSGLQSGLQLRPAAMGSSRLTRTGFVRISAEQAYQRLQFLSGFAALLQMRPKQPSKSRPTSMLRAHSEPALGVAPSRDQLLQRADGETMTHDDAFVVRPTRN
ncbi:MAG TPA: hypothetical protein VFB37_00395 [Steroidobacteraceae bacterium]|nr:hypothetical protein [Steroidobacteraceae bacterium]